MKLLEYTVVRRGLGLGVMFLVTSLCLGAETIAGSKQSPSTKLKAKTTAPKKKTAEKAKFVEVTGSRLKYRVKDGEQSAATALSVTVIDPKSPVNRGYSSPMEMLMRTPSVTRGY